MKELKKDLINHETSNKGVTCANIYKKIFAQLTNVQKEEIKKRKILRFSLKIAIMIIKIIIKKRLQS